MAKKKSNQTPYRGMKSQNRLITAWIEYAHYYPDLGVAVTELAGAAGLVLLLKEQETGRYFHSLWDEEGVRALTSKAEPLSEDEMVEFAFKLSTRTSPVQVEVKPEDEIPIEVLQAVPVKEAAPATTSKATPTVPAVTKKPIPNFKLGKKKQ